MKDAELELVLYTAKEYDWAAVTNYNEEWHDLREILFTRGDTKVTWQGEDEVIYVDHSVYGALYIRNDESDTILNVLKLIK